MAIISCDNNMHFACANDGCLKSNFMLSDPHLVLRDDQRSISLASTSASTSAGATPNPSAPSTTSRLLPNPSAVCPSLGSTPASISNDPTSRFIQRSKVVTVGVGVGISLGLAILTIVAFFMVEKRKNQRLMQENRRIKTENESYMGPIWINRHGPPVEAPQDLDPREMASGPLAHELDAGTT